MIKTINLRPDDSKNTVNLNELSRKFKITAERQSGHWLGTSSSKISIVCRVLHHYILYYYILFVFVAVTGRTKSYSAIVLQPPGTELMYHLQYIATYWWWKILRVSCCITILMSTIKVIHEFQHNNLYQKMRIINNYSAKINTPQNKQPLRTQNSIQEITVIYDLLMGMLNLYFQLIKQTKNSISYVVCLLRVTKLKTKAAYFKSHSINFGDFVNSKRLLI